MSTDNNIKDKGEYEINNNKINVSEEQKYIEKNNEKENKEKNECYDNNDNNDTYDYKALYDDKILGRFSLKDKICIINKLNILIYGKIRKELLMELNAKRFENKILLLKSRYKTELILKKKLHSLVQEKMLRDFHFKKKLKDLRKKLMDEKIENLKNKNLIFIMKAYGIYREEQFYR